MADTKHTEFASTATWLMHNISRFLEENMHENDWLDDEAFGWMACQDSSVVSRLMNGGDVRTNKMDVIIAFMKNPVPPKKWERAVLKPINLTRRFYV